MNQHLVASGDTLSAIAQKYGVGLTDILKANPAITNPNLIKTGQNIVIPGGVPAPTDGAVSPPVNPSENPALSQSGRYVIDQSNGADVYDTQTGQKISQTEFQSLGLNEKFIKRSDVSGLRSGTGGEQTVDDFLSGLGITIPGVSDGTEDGKIKSAVTTAQTQLADFQASLKKELDKIDNNPFLVTSESLGEKRRVIRDNQDQLKSLTNAYNTALSTYKDYTSTREKSATRRDDLIKFAATQIQKRADTIAATIKDAGEREIAIQRLRNDTPAGQSFSVDGKTYAGVKKATGTGTGDDDKVKKAFNTALSGWDKAGSRETFISRLQFLYPTIEPSDIATAVYSYYKDGFQNDIKPTVADDPFKKAMDTITSYKNEGFSRKDIEAQYKDAGQPVPLEVQKALDTLF